ncbi:hypothetical protein [Streptomyces sp. NPDC001530]|uniref:hypothetical protein n=1 Tax=Streptomyces sp. NPDC001530 TaxID=3364582 RepID=UPI0036C8DAEF
MRWILLGALLGLLLVLCPAFLLGLVAALASQPIIVAFAAGAVLWPRIARRARRWAR